MGVGHQQSPVDEEFGAQRLHCDHSPTGSAAALRPYRRPWRQIVLEVDHPLVQESSAVARIRTASRPALRAPPIDTVATGTPASICTIGQSESIPSRYFSGTGTPMTGSGSPRRPSRAGVRPRPPRQ